MLTLGNYLQSWYIILCMDPKSWLTENWFKCTVVLLLICLSVIAAIFVKKYKYIPELIADPVQIVTVERLAATSSPTGIDLPAIIKEWYPSVVRIECYIRGKSGKLDSQLGSGFLKYEGGVLYAFTNRHIIVDEDGVLPQLCTIKLPNSDDPYIVKYDEDEYKDEIGLASSSVDFGYLKVRWADTKLKRSALRDNSFCSTKADIGSPLITIGYPAVGAESDITVTQGIVAGYDGDYYITDAKIGHGNSGGVAILVDQNSKKTCMLGIPTFAQVGEAVSLGRILNIQKVDGLR